MHQTIYNIKLGLIYNLHIGSGSQDEGRYRGGLYEDGHQEPQVPEAHIVHPQPRGPDGGRGEDRYRAEARLSAHNILIQSGFGCCLETICGEEEALARRGEKQRVAVCQQVLGLLQVQHHDVACAELVD